MPGHLFHIAERLIARPLLIAPDKAQIIFDVLAPRLFGDNATFDLNLPEANRFESGSFGRADRNGGLSPMRNGIATITITGSLVNRGAWIGAYSGVTSYEGITAQVNDAANDPEVSAIVLDIHSPGGEAHGMFSLSRAVMAARQKKPVVAVVNDLCASAAFGIAAGASEIVVSETSVVGSIGVVLLHLDRSAELNEKGIKPTLIHAGAHKVDGNPFEPLPEGVRSDLQAEVNKIYQLFVSCVAEGRGRKLSAKAARETEARTFLGAEAVERGLADRVGTYEAVVASLARSRRSQQGSARAKGATLMNDLNEPQAEAPAAAPTAAPAAPVPDANAVKARIKEITTCEEAKGREELAQKLAFDSDMSAEQAKDMLRAAPKKEEAAARAPANVDGYMQQKQQDGTLGAVAAPEPREGGYDTDAMWNRAIKSANERIAGAA